MKCWMALMVVSMASAAVAADRPDRLGPLLGPVLTQLQPTPLPESEPVQVPSPGPATVMPSPMVVTPTLALYTNVKVKDRRNIAPCAVSKIVQVPDPCNPCCCVNIEICVPPCGCEEVKVSKCGTKLKYDYGKYEVEITSRRGHVVVDYDD